MFEPHHRTLLYMSIHHNCQYPFLLDNCQYPASCMFLAPSAPFTRYFIILATIMTSTLM